MDKKMLNDLVEELKEMNDALYAKNKELSKDCGNYRSELSVYRASMAALTASLKEREGTITAVANALSCSNHDQEVLVDTARKMNRGYEFAVGAFNVLGMLIDDIEQGAGFEAIKRIESLRLRSLSEDAKPAFELENKRLCEVVANQEDEIQQLKSQWDSWHGRVNAECQFQDAKWGAGHDDAKTNLQWVDHINERWSRMNNEDVEGQQRVAVECAAMLQSFCLSLSRRSMAGDAGDVSRRLNPIVNLDRSKRPPKGMVYRSKDLEANAEVLIPIDADLCHTVINLDGGRGRRRLKCDEFWDDVDYVYGVPQPHSGVDFQALNATMLKEQDAASEVIESLKAQIAEFTADDENAKHELRRVLEALNEGSGFASQSMDDAVLRVQNDRLKLAERDDELLRKSLEASEATAANSRLTEEAEKLNQAVVESKEAALSEKAKLEGYKDGVESVVDILISKAQGLMGVVHNG